MAHGFLNGARYDQDEMSLAQHIEGSIVDIKIPEGVKVITDYLFYSSGRFIKSVSIPNTVQQIRPQAFNSIGADVGIDQVVIPDSVTSLGANSFRYSGVRSFVISPNIRYLYTQTFDGCKQCTLYDFSRHESVPILQETNVFGGINAEAKILVPAELYHEWIKATNWSAYADYILVKAPEFPDPGYVSEGLEINNGIVEGLGSCTDSTVVIPSEYNGEPVTDIDISGMDEETIEHLVFNDLIFYVSWTLGYLPELKRVTFGAGLKGVGPGVFNENAKCTVYDFTRCLAVPELQLLLGDEVFSFTGMPDDCRIYVPHSLYDEWINDTNWSYYADRIVPAI